MGAVISVVASVISAAAASYSAYESKKAGERQKKAAQKSEKLQKKKLAEQEKQASLRARRQQAEQSRRARIAAAGFEAQAGAVGGGSIFAGAQASAQTIAEQNKSLIQEQYESQTKQFGLAGGLISAQTDAVVASANARIAASWATIVGSIGKAGGMIGGIIQAEGKAPDSTAGSGAPATTAGGTL